MFVSIKFLFAIVIMGEWKVVITDFCSILDRYVCSYAIMCFKDIGLYKCELDIWVSLISFQRFS